MREQHENSILVLRKAQEEERYTKLIMQLLKDFGRVNIKVGFTLLITPEDLKRAVHEKIYHLLMEKDHDYRNLMYVVDVPEKELEKSTCLDPVDLAEKVTFLVLRRELQKVRSKEKFE